MSLDHCLAGSPFEWEVGSLRGIQKPYPPYCPGHLESSEPLMANVGCRTGIQLVAGRAVVLTHFLVIAVNMVVPLLHGLSNTTQRTFTE